MSGASKASKNEKGAIIEDVAGVILAGGKSLRYGKNKALVEVNGVPLIDRVISVMGSVFRDLVLITNTPHEYAHLKLPMYEDVIKGLGPLGGIFTGLRAVSKDAAFVVACDMPTLKGDLIRHMTMQRNDFDVVVPKISWKIEALHALYHKRCIPPIRKLIQSGNYQVIRIFPEMSVRYVTEDEIRRFDPHFNSFYNVNRPDELRRLKKPCGN